MEIRKAYKVRLYPTQEQQQVLLQTVGACRWVYNYYLELQINAYFQTGKTLPYAALSADLTKLRNSDDYAWLKEVQATPVQQSLRRLDVAYSRFFRKQSRLPRFHSKNDRNQSFSKPIDWRIADNRIVVQDNLRLKYRGSLPLEEVTLKSITVSVRPSGKWYASINVIENIESNSEYTSPLGIDLGLTHIAITSDGRKFDNLTLAKKRAKRLKYLQQSLSRKQKNSKRYDKARLEVARLHEKVSNQRMNHIHQASSAITSKNHALIAVEDLAVANMLKNRHLSRSISDVSWGELLRQLEYKQSWRGGQFIRVDRFFPSSKTCSACGYINQSMPLSVRRWNCPSCGIQHDRDVNAAQNILKQAEIQLGVERKALTPVLAGSETASTKRGRGNTISIIPQRRI